MAVNLLEARLEALVLERARLVREAAGLETLLTATATADAGSAGARERTRRVPVGGKSWRSGLRRA